MSDARCPIISAKCDTNMLERESHLQVIGKMIPILKNPSDLPHAAIDGKLNAVDITRGIGC